MIIKKFGGWGVTSWINDLIKKVETNNDRLIGIGRVNDGSDNYTFIALFSESISDDLLALIHEWGTNDDKSGEGGRGFIKMNNFLKERNYKVIDLVLSKEDCEQIGYFNNNRFLSNWNDRAKIWEKYVNKINNYSSN